MDYDPVKDRLGAWFERSTPAYRAFMGLLHVFFLRAWHVRRMLRDMLRGREGTIRVLDAGTGFGQFTDWLLRRTPQVHATAVDIKQDYLDRLEGYLQQAGLADRADVRPADLTRLDLDGPFDLILSVDVMEHIEEDVAVFEHFRRVLAPGGEVLINTPSDQGGSDIAVEGESFIGEHVRDGYGADEIRDKLARAGLEAVDIRYTYGAFGSLGWRLLIKVPMQLLGASFWTLPLVVLWYIPAFPVGMLLNALDLVGRNRTGTGLLVRARAAG